MGQSLDQLSLIASSMTDKMPKAGKAKPCSMLWNRIHLTCEGYLTLCCVDYENSLVYSDLSVDSLETAWHNEVIKEMRKTSPKIKSLLEHYAKIVFTGLGIRYFL